jgi:hypothetical protein
MATELFGEPVREQEELFGEPAGEQDELFGEPASQGRGTGTMRDVGRGLLAAPVTLVQGIAELAALGADLAFDTDYARRTNQAFEGIKTAIGAQPEGAAGQIVEEVAAFGLGFIPVVGWLGRASAAARGTTAASAPARSLYMRTAETFGQSATGRTLLGTRARLAGTTALAAAGYETIVTPDGYGTVADAFDMLPEFMRTEGFDDSLSGREDALRRLRNRARRGSEAAAFSGAVDTLLIGGGRAGAAVMATPGIGPGISAGLRATRSVFEAATEQVGRVPGARSTGDFFRRWFSPGGGVDPRMAELNFDRTAFSDTARRQALGYYNALNTGMDNLFESLKLTGRGRDGVARAQRDLTEYLQGNYNALDGYDAGVREAADRMQRLTFEYEDMLLREIDIELARYAGGRGPAQRGPSTMGIQKLEQTREEILKQRQLASDQREAIRAGRQAAGEALSGMENAQSTYLRRRFEMYEAPERFYSKMDPRFMDSPEFAKAVQEVMDNTGGMLTQDEARQKVLTYLGLDLLADGRLSPADALRQRSQTAARERLGEGVFPQSSDIRVVESMFIPREELLNASPTLRQLMGEVTDPKTLFVNTISDLSETVSNIRFARSLVDDGFVMPGANAVDALARGSRPMFVDPGDVRAALPQLPAMAGRTFTPELLENTQNVLRNYGYKPLGETADPTHPFMGVYGQLTGMWAPPEVHAALNMFGRLGQTHTSEVIALGTLAKAMSQQMTVVMNPLSQMRNVMGNFYFLAGNANLGRDLSAFDSLRMVTGSIADLDDAAAARLAREMGQLGVVDTALATSQIAAMRRMGRDLNVNGTVQQAMDKVSRHVPFLGRLHSFLNRTYSDVDTVFKVGNTLAEESKLMTTLARAGLDDTNPAVRQAMIENGLAVRATSDIAPDIPFRRLYAAEVTKDVMPTYNRVPRAVRALDMTPFFGAFTSFASENIRNSANTLGRGMKEMSFSVSPALRQQMGEEAARALEAGIRGQGAARLVSFLTVAGTMPAAASVASARVAGMSDEDVGAFYQLMPEFTAGHAILFTGFDRRTGDVEYVDQSYVNPYAFATDGARAALREYQRTGTLNAESAARIASSLWAGIGAYAEPFGTESLAFERLRDVLPAGWVGRGGETPTGARIYGESESLGTKLSKSFNHVVGGFLPGYAREFVQPRQGQWGSGRLTRAMTGIPGPQGQEYNLQEEAARLVSGYTPMTINLRRDFWYNGAEYTALRSEAKGIATNAIRASDTTPPQMLAAWDTYLNDLYRHQSALYADVLAARQLGLSDTAIIRQLRQRANMGAAEAALIVRGRFYPTGPSREMIGDIRRETIAEGRARRTVEPPYTEFQRRANARMNQPLSPQMGIEAQRQRYSNPVQQLRDPAAFGEPVGAPSGGAPAPMPTQAPAPQQSAPAPQQPQAPAIQPAPAPQVTRAPVAPGLLGTNPMDILRNMEVAQRTGSG